MSSHVLDLPRSVRRLLRKLPFEVGIIAGFDKEAIALTCDLGLSIQHRVVWWSLRLGPLYLTADVEW